MPLGVKAAGPKAGAASSSQKSDRGDKKTRAQREGLALLEQLVTDLVKGGLATLDEKRAGKLVEQARQMNDAYLPGAAEKLRRIAALAFEGELREPGADLPDELRFRLMTRHLTRLWAMVRRAQQFLDASSLAAPKHDGQRGHDETFAVVEELLGRVFKLDELRARGRAKHGLELFEIAYERYDDRVREERIEQSFLVDLGSAAVYVDRALRPLAALGRTKEKESFDKPLSVADGVVYPGFLNRRIRWEVSAHEPRSVVREDFDRIHAAAHAALEPAIAALKEQLKNPLSPDDGVVLVRAKHVRSSGGGLALVDPAGATLLLRDSPLARYRSLGNLAMAAGAALSNDGTLEQPASLLLRLYVDLESHAIHGQPLSLVVGTNHVRLGM
jgi:hypothetical protein